MQGFAVPKEAQDKVAKFSFHGQLTELKHGSVVIVAITSCTNTSNPSVMLGAGLVAKKACEFGLQVRHGYMSTPNSTRIPPLLPSCNPSKKKSLS